MNRSLVLGLACLAGCVDALDLPVAPGVGAFQDLELRYQDPTADISKQTALDVLEVFEEREKALKHVDDFSFLTPTLVEVSESFTVTKGPSGGLRFRDIPMQADAEITVVADCPGWNGVPQHDAIRVSLIVKKSVLTPIAWGAISNCRLEVAAVEGAGLDAIAFSGDIAAYFPALENDERKTNDVLVVFRVFDMLFKGDEIPELSGSMRVIDGRIEMLIEQDLIGTVVMHRGEAGDSVGIRARNGDWTCYPKERRCDSTVPGVPSLSL